MNNIVFIEEGLAEDYAEDIMLKHKKSQQVVLNRRTGCFTVQDINFDQNDDDMVLSYCIYEEEIPEE